MQPLAVFDMWWQQTRQCSGRRGDLDDITWYEVPGAESIPTEIGNVQGMWLPGNHIVLAGKSVKHGPLVRHEMLHALLQGGGHPREKFIDRCAGVVVCVDTCTTDDGPAPPPDPSAELLVQDDVTVSVAIDPGDPSSALEGGNFRLVVTATNPLDVPIIADVAQCFLCPLVTFSYRIYIGDALAYSYDMTTEYPEERRFAAHESKRFIFDFRNRGGPRRYDIYPGSYFFQGAYGGRFSASVPVSVSP